MQDNIAIKVSGLTKSYKLFKNPSDRVKEAFHPLRQKYHHAFNALSDVSFEVKRGETLGIVGRNGSGKSTLLQIVCGVLNPTSGSVETRGRISALLELGAGFNPEFTGRQNVYLNGSILGLDRSQIDKKLSDILEFAEIGEFIDQPVRTYSSGMYIRLAFAIAINIDPEILVVDEALAVGDEAFQRKCFSRIRNFQERGGTIVFVSHAASIIVELCSRAMMLDQGELLLCGEAKKVVADYHKMIFAPAEKVAELKTAWKSDPNRFCYFGSGANCGQLENSGCGERKDADPGGKEEDSGYYDPSMLPKSTLRYQQRGASITDPHLETLDGRRVNGLSSKRLYVYTYQVVFDKPAFKVRFGMMIKTVSGLEVVGSVTEPFGGGIEYVEKGSCWKVGFRFECRLTPGVYFMNAGVVGIESGNEIFLDRHIDAVMFRVQPEKYLTSTAIVDLVEPFELVMVG